MVSPPPNPKIAMNKKLWLTGIIVVLAASAIQAADQPKAKPPRTESKPALPAGVSVQRDLEYIPGGHVRNKLDLYLPAKADYSLPVIVWIHGGGWTGR